MAKVPVLSNPQQETNVPIIKKPRAVPWAFSFKYFRQVDFFGLGRNVGIDMEWFISVLERLSDLSQYDNGEFNNPLVAEAFRHHKINWEAKNIPVQRPFFDWIDKDYLDNDVDFPFHQFHISKAVGRIVGFWNEDSTIFFLVVLDPMHNLQPSNRVDYRVRDTHPLSCQYSSLLIDIDKCKGQCKDPTCGALKNLNSVPSKSNIYSNILLLHIDDDYQSILEKAEAQGVRLIDILELGLLHAEKKI